MAYKRKRITSGKVVNKRRRLNSKALVRAPIKKIIRFIKENKPEVKLCRYTGGAAFQDNTIKSWNIAYQMFSQGVGENQFIGKKLHMKWLTLKYYADNAAVHQTAGGGSACLDIKYRVLVVASKVYKTTTDLNASEIFD